MRFYPASGGLPLYRPNRQPGYISVNFRFYIPEQITVEKGGQIDFQAIADLLYGGYRSGMIPAADDIVQGGLGNAALGAKAVQRQLVFPAKLHDSLPNCFLGCHIKRPFSLFG